MAVAWRSQLGQALTVCRSVSWARQLLFDATVPIERTASRTGKLYSDARMVAHRQTIDSYGLPACDTSTGHQAVRGADMVDEVVASELPACDDILERQAVESGSVQCLTQSVAGPR